MHYLFSASFIVYFGWMCMFCPTKMSAQNDLSTRINRMGELTDQDRVDLANEYLLYQRSIENALIDQFDHSPSNHIGWTAAYLLGRMRSDRAVPSLNRMIVIKGWEGPHPQKMSSIDTEPVIQALVEIGLPSIPLMLTNIITTSDNNVRSRSCLVLKCIDGKACALKRVTTLLELQTNATTQANCRLAIKTIQSLPDNPN